MPVLNIGGRLVGDGQPCFIIAEAGINHQGDLSIAKRLIDVAAFVGADAVKFQKRNVERSLSRSALEMPYINDNSFGTTYGGHRRALELSDDAYCDLKRYSDEKGIIFLVSAWDEESADFLKELGVSASKIGSPDLTNLPLIEHVARSKRPVILSTGMSTLVEVDQAVATLRRYTNQFALLQCTSTYPCKFSEINLRAMQMLRERYGCVVGYSGHELGIAIPPVAVVLGASIVERHFTLDRTMKGGDHAASLEPGGLQRLVRDIRHVEEALGNTEKVLLESEWPVRLK